MAFGICALLLLIVFSSGCIDFGGEEKKKDTTPPTISGVTASSITSSGATISWTTNEKSSAVVEYGTTTSYGSTATGSDSVTSHSVGLSGLSAGTTYHYRVKSIDSSDNTATSDDYTFTTTADTTPPVISNVQASSITGYNATITWTTDEPATSRVEYCTETSSVPLWYQSTSLVTTHNITLTGLSSSTTYTYNVESKDASDNLATSSNYTFTTLSTVATTVYVGGGGPGNYTTIQAGIDAANDGDTVFIYSKTYYEHITITKKINLVGEEKDTTIIDGGNTGTVVSVYGSASYARIANFTIRNGKDFTNTIKYGIRVVGSYTAIENCNIHSNEGGIYIWGNNTLVKNCDVCSNDIDGIWLYISSYNSIQNCNISYSKQGIYIGSNASYNEITRCTLQNNAWRGIEIHDDSKSNVIYHNNFNNTVNAYDGCTNSWDNGYPSGGNYWDDYTGVDANGDGIGDTPYDIFGGDNQDRYPLMSPVGEGGDGDGTSNSRVVLAELCTATWCGACPYATDALDQLANEYGSTKLVVLEYHPSSDPFGTSETDARINYYGITGYPTCIFDGTEEVVGGGSSTYDTYKEKIDSELLISSPMTITVSGSLGTTTGTVNAHIVATDAITQTNLKVRLMIYEDNIYYEASNGETNHRFVVRDVLPEESITISEGQFKDVSRTFTIQDEWNKNNLSAVVFVQTDSTKAVLQAGIYNFVTTKNSRSTTLCFCSNKPLYPQADDISTVTTRLEDIRLLREENRKII